MKKILIFSTILVILVVAGAVIYFNWRHNFIRNEVPQLVFLKSDSLYTISYGDVYIDEINGEVRIDNILLKPDTTHKTDKDDILPRVMLEVFIPRLHMTGLHTEQAMLNEELIARKLELTRPVLTLYRNYEDKEQVKKDKDEAGPADLYRAILRNLLRIKIDSVLIDSGRYSMVQWVGRDTVLTGSPVTVSLFDLDIRDSTRMDTTRVLFAKRANLRFDSLKINNDAGFYTYRILSAELNSEQKLLTVKNLFVVPLYGEAEFMRVMGKQIDRFDVDFTNARFTNIDVGQVLGGNLVADTLVVKEAVLKVFRDKNYPRRNVNKVGRYPHQLLMKSNMAISLKRIDIKSGYIEYKEKTDLTGNTGNIRFHNIAISMTNFTNRPKDLRENPGCLVNLRAQFLNVLPVNITLRLYPAHVNGKFTASGNLGSADALVLNQLVQPLGLANIQSGKVNGCEFRLEGNDYGASGTVKFLYSNLKVRLLEKGAEDGEYKKKGFASFLANATIKDENPKKNKPPRIAHVNYKRDPNKSFFNLVWKTIFTGIGETVGIEAK